MVLINAKLVSCNICQVNSVSAVLFREGFNLFILSSEFDTDIINTNIFSVTI